MIKYHGTPITINPRTPQEKCDDTALRSHLLVSYCTHMEKGTQSINQALMYSQSFVLDNGAFSFWRKPELGEKYGIRGAEGWDQFYVWVREHKNHPAFDWALIPDVIDGSEEDNDALLEEWDKEMGPRAREIGVPVWHLHESLRRLVRMARRYPRIAIGSSGEFATIQGRDGSPWRQRMTEAWDALCCMTPEGRPPCKVHGLRMLNVNIYPDYPWASGDSTNLAANHSRETKKNQERGIDSHGLDTLKHRIEGANPGDSWELQGPGIDKLNDEIHEFFSTPEAPDERYRIRFCTSCEQEAAHRRGECCNCFPRNRESNLTTLTSSVGLGLSTLERAEVFEWVID